MRWHVGCRDYESSGRQSKAMEFEVDDKILAAVKAMKA